MDWLEEKKISPLSLLLFFSYLLFSISQHCMGQCLTRRKNHYLSLWISHSPLCAAHIRFSAALLSPGCYSSPCTVSKSLPAVHSISHSSCLAQTIPFHTFSWKKFLQSQSWVANDGHVRETQRRRGKERWLIARVLQSMCRMPPSVILICSKLEVNPTCLLELTGIFAFVAPMKKWRNDGRD